MVIEQVIVQVFVVLFVVEAVNVALAVTMVELNSKVVAFMVILIFVIQLLE